MSVRALHYFCILKLNNFSHLLYKIDKYMCLFIYIYIYNFIHKKLYFHFKL